MLRRAPRTGEVTDDAPRRSRRAGDEEHDDGPTAADIERFGDVTQTCPECGKEVFDDTDICYHCGHAIRKDPASARTPRWVIVVIIIIVLTFVFGVLRGVL